MGRNGSCRIRSTRPSFRARSRKLSSTPGGPCASATSPTFSSGTLEPMHCGEQRKAPFCFPRACQDPEVGPAPRTAPQRDRADRDTAPTSIRMAARSSAGPAGLNRSSGTENPPPAAMLSGSDAAFGSRVRHRPRRSRARRTAARGRRAPRMRMISEASRVASGHADHVRHARHLRGEMTRDPVGLHIVTKRRHRTDARHAPGGDRRELRDEGAGHRNVRLRAVDRIGPMNRDRARVVVAPRSAPNPPPSCACGTADAPPLC